MLLQVGHTLDELSLIGARSSDTVHQLVVNPIVAMVFITGFLIFFILVILPRLIDDTLGIGSGLAIFIIGLSISSLPLVINALGMPVPFITKASPSKIPENLKLDNLESTSLTISWETAEAVLSAIRFGTSPQLLEQAAFSRDPLEKSTKHTITITKLQPDTSYFLELISGGERYNYQGQPIEIHTPPIQ